MKEILFGSLKRGGSAVVDIENGKMIIKKDEAAV